MFNVIGLKEENGVIKERVISPFDTIQDAQKYIDKSILPWGDGDNRFKKNSALYGWHWAKIEPAAFVTIEKQTK